MNIKGLLVAVASVAACGTAIAQDKIFKSNGEVLNTKIRNVGPRQIIYVRYDNASGPEYTIAKNDVDKIRYENGSEESFGTERTTQERPLLRKDSEHLATKYKENIIGFAPIQFTEAGIAGFSFSYERAIDPRDIVAFYVPVIAEFNMNSDNNYYYSGTTTNVNDAMFYAMPGIKIYPTGGYGVTKYAIGPSLVVGGGTKTTFYDPAYNPYNQLSQNHFVFGMIVNQSLNINPTPHLYLGSELGLGFTYINKLGGVSQGTQALVQFSFKVGYRF